MRAADRPHLALFVVERCSGRVKGHNIELKRSSGFVGDEGNRFCGVEARFSASRLINSIWRHQGETVGSMLSFLRGFTGKT